MRTPIHQVRGTGPWAIHSLDGIDVDLETYTVKGSELDDWRLTGSQADGPFGLSRPSNFDPAKTYFVRDRIIIDLKSHRLISEHADFAGWTTIARPILTCLALLTK